MMVTLVAGSSLGNGSIGLPLREVVAEDQARPGTLHRPKAIEYFSHRIEIVSERWHDGLFKGLAHVLIVRIRRQQYLVGVETHQ
jgi:hypothetical protein